MILTTSATPLETVQIISILSYLNTLSDFLYEKNLLQEQDLYKKIPVVNALYEYFDKNEDNPDEKMILVRKLLEGSDLYGEKEHEAVDMQFVSTMFDHIISTFVFEEFGNIYGFLADIVRTSEYITRDSLFNDIINILLNLTFYNENGKSSFLCTSSVERILTDLISPLFPLSPHDQSILSVDYIYAQAGITFLRTGQSKNNYFTHIRNSTFENANRDTINHNTLFDDYILVGQTIESLVENRNISESVLSVFFLPALLNYVHQGKHNLKSLKIQEIITDSNHWTKAFESLFSYLHYTFTISFKALDNDYRYQLHLALANFKNRTVLARNTIEINCSSANDSNVEAKVTAYLKKIDGYTCEKDSTQIFLPNLNLLYDLEIGVVAEKYFQYEKESIREAFGQSLIDSLIIDKIIIVKGSFVKKEIELSDDLFEFYDPKELMSVHYALIRRDNNVLLIKEEDNPILFRQKLNVSIHETFAHLRFIDIYKRENEDFEQFLFNIAEERKRLFAGQFYSFDFPHKRGKWWKEIGNSLIPFYSCITDSTKGEIFNSTFPCPLDTFLLFCAAGELEDVTSKITTAETQDTFSNLGVTLKTISSREFVRKLINTEIVRSLNMLENLQYQKLRRALVRLNNNGIELSSIINIQEFTSIQMIIEKVENIARLPLQSVRNMLSKAKKIVIGSVLATDEQFFEHTVNVKSIDAYTNTGYGYKFIFLPSDEIAEMRHEHGFENEILVKYHHTTDRNEKIYREVDAETMSFIKHYLKLKNDGLFVKFPEPEPSAIDIPLYNAGKCYDESNSKIVDEIDYCPRTSILDVSFSNLQSALTSMLQNGDFEEVVIEKKITEFYFPLGRRTEYDLVDYWKNHDASLPDWSIEYKITEPELFHDLRFKTILDSEKITEEDAIKRIWLLYFINESHQIISTAISMRSEYLKRKVYYSLRFEDYFAIGYQQGLCGLEGYIRLGENTDEGRRMRNALYRLAIRQNFDPIDMFPQKLYTGEKRPQEIIDKLFVPGKDFTFDRFTTALRKKEKARDYASRGMSEDPIVLYEINFTGRYMRAKVEKIYDTIQEESVLLPHHKYQIEKVIKKSTELGGSYWKVVLKHQRKDPLEEMKNVLEQISKLKKSGTRFYADEEPENATSKIPCLRNCNN